ncbi:protein LTO1 homolog [Zingiber officinale]|uniref:protein LTO1 homolog n=1 Tax=Zingiber officinale TaxID=94328 RepID=UPI001C4C109E|nr:protein LTO1 homolog [Zingiber officinale]
MEGKPGDDDLDLFDSAVLLDEALRQEGFDDGYKDGLISGKEEGKEVGLKTGFQVGEELGFYRGCVDVWNSLLHIDPEAFSSRIRKNVQQLEDLLKKYPLLDPENEDVQEVMEAIRLKFRIITANMGVKLDYEGYPKSSAAGIEDV